MVAWAAGFLEGEGSFRVLKRTRIVRATNNEVEPLRRLLSLFGGRIAFSKTSTTGNDSWEWYVKNEQADSVVDAIYSLMSERRRGQIDAAFAARHPVRSYVRRRPYKRSSL